MCEASCLRAIRQAIAVSSNITPVNGKSLSGSVAYCYHQFGLAKRVLVGRKNTEIAASLYVNLGGGATAEKCRNTSIRLYGCSTVNSTHTNFGDGVCCAKANSVVIFGGCRSSIFIRVVPVFLLINLPAIPTVDALECGFCAKSWYRYLRGR